MKMILLLVRTLFGRFLLMVIASMAIAFADDSFRVTTPAFASGMSIPLKYAMAGQNLSPAIHVSGVPAHTQSLVLIVDDPDAPAGLWTHWLVWNLPANTTSITEGNLPVGAQQGKNSFGNVHYDGPSPPSGTHRYYFHLYALDTTIPLPSGSDRPTLESAIDGHILATSQTFGTYQTPP